MMRSLWISKTGMEAQQTQLDVVSHNLANVGTNGFKRAHAVFEDLMYQSLRQSGANSSEQTQLPTGLQVGLTAGTTDAEGRVFVASQAGHILVSANSGATFKRADIERPLPAAALVAVDRNLLVVAGPRGVEAKPVQ